MIGKNHILAAFVLFLATGLTAQAQDGQGFSLGKTWETRGFSMPESVVSVPDHPWIYVSNVNGEDADGFISRLARDGTLDMLKWVEGIKSPTGMAAHNGELFVVNQTEVVKINLETGEITARYHSATATSLNDIDISASGRVFVSELQGGAIHTLDGNKLVPWIKSDDFPYPNGVLVSGDNLLIGNVGLELSRDLKPDQYGSIYRANLSTKTVELLPATELMGTWDGLAPYGEGVLASSPFSGAIWYFTGSSKSLLGTFEGGVADIATDAQAGVMFAPFLFSNTVVAYKLTPFTWDRLTTEDQFRTQIVDQYFGDDGGQSVAKADGTIEGEFNGQVLKGTWGWDGDYFCRTSTLGELDLGHDCLVIEATETQMRLTLQKGKGPSVIYDRK